MFPECTSLIHFPIEQDIVEQNRSSFPTPTMITDTKQRKIHIIVKSIHSFLRSESKMVNIL